MRPARSSWASIAPLLSAFLPALALSAGCGLEAEGGSPQPLSSPSGEQEPACSTEQEALDIGVEAYIYAYPLVTMELTRRILTNVVAPEGTLAPMGQFAHQRSYPDASFRVVTAPNADTLYSSAFVDVSVEPYVLHVPDENGRYYLLPHLGMWTDVFASIGKRTTGTGAGDFAITGPGWEGTLPPGVMRLEAPTSVVWIIGRTYSTGSPEDLAAVHALQQQYTLTPLSQFGRCYTPPAGVVDPQIDMTTPTRDQVNALDAEAFFAILAESWKKNPPAAADAPILARLARIGLVPGRDFDIDALPPEVRAGLERAPRLGLQEIIAYEAAAGMMVNGWMLPGQTGVYGTDYLQRAYIAYFGLGANLREDAIYPVAKVDGSGAPLDGANRYVVHFPAGQLPPVSGFWSLTMYDADFFFVDNPLDKYTVSPRDALVYNDDGSLDLYVQSESPGAALEANWLPAPRGPFVLMMRLYWPKQAVLDGSWTPPAIQKLAPEGSAP